MGIAGAVPIFVWGDTTVIVDKEAQPQLYQFVHDSNLLRQYDLLKSCVRVAIEKNTMLPSIELLKMLNHTAVTMLCPHAGNLRPHDVVIKRSVHRPPPHRDVGKLLEQFFSELERHWETQEPLWLAAYCLWRINWIHPFAEGNGRTARAVCLFVLCVKFGMWLPGGNIVPQQIRNDRQPYYDALGRVDASFNEGRLNLTVMRDYLDGLLIIQLSS